MLLVNNSFCLVFKQNDTGDLHRDCLEHTSTGLELEKIESLDNIKMEWISDAKDLESLFYKINLMSQETVEEMPETSHLEDSCLIPETDP